MEKNNKKSNHIFLLVYCIIAGLSVLLFFGTALKEYPIERSIGLSVVFLVLLIVYYVFIRLLTSLIVHIIKIRRLYLYIIISLIGFPIIFYCAVCVIEQKFIPFSSLNADNWIGVFSGILGYYGTCLLGFLAFWQNEKSSRLSEKLAEIALADNYCAIQPQEKLLFSVKRNDGTQITLPAAHEIDSYSLILSEPYDTKTVQNLNEYFMRLYFRDHSSARLRKLIVEDASFVQDTSENGLMWSDKSDDPIPQGVNCIFFKDCTINWITDKDFYINLKIYSPQRGLVSEMLENKESVCFMLQLHLENIVKTNSDMSIRLWLNKGKNNKLRIQSTSAILIDK